jgi:hypothetical protein
VTVSPTLKQAKALVAAQLGSKVEVQRPFKSSLTLLGPI